jgi:hypothetical protein
MLGGYGLLDTDDVRLTLFPKPTYSREESQFVYAFTCNMARSMLNRGLGTIMTGTFTVRESLEELLEIAIEHCVPWHFILVEVSEEQAKRNEAAKEMQKARGYMYHGRIHFSEADLSVFNRFVNKHDFELAMFDHRATEYDARHTTNRVYPTRLCTRSSNFREQIEELRKRLAEEIAMAVISGPPLSGKSLVAESLKYGVPEFWQADREYTP